MAEAPSQESAAGTESVRGWKGHALDDVSGAAVGKVDGAFADPRPGGSPWLLARMGRFGHYTLVPARDAVAGAGRVWVPYTRDHIRRAPRVDPRRGPDDEAERTLRAHYGLAG